MRKRSTSPAHWAQAFRRLAVPLALAGGAAVAQLVAMPAAHALNLSPCELVTPGTPADGCRTMDQDTGVTWLIKATAAAAFGDGTSVDGKNLTDPNVAPWWTGNADDPGLAPSFAGAVGTTLGFTNPFLNYNQGPLFAFGSRSVFDFDPITVENIVDVLIGIAFVDGAGVNFAVGPRESSRRSYAYATREAASTSNVPGPLPVFGAAAAFGYSRKLRKRIKAS